MWLKRDYSAVVRGSGGYGYKEAMRPGRRCTSPGQRDEQSARVHPENVPMMRRGIVYANGEAALLLRRKPHRSE